MREIKFRAWDKQYNRWAVSAPTIVERFHKSLPSCELMQYTGLKDKNGKEIYEGDIVAIENYNSFLKKWLPHNTEVKWFGAGFRAMEGSISNDLTFLPNHNEVIGNIYENKDLLE